MTYCYIVYYVCDIVCYSVMWCIYSVCIIYILYKKSIVIYSMMHYDIVCIGVSYCDMLVYSSILFYMVTPYIGKYNWYPYLIIYINYLLYNSTIYHSLSYLTHTNGLI